MKKLILVILIIFSLNGISKTDAHEISYDRKYSKTYYKGNISPQDLPKSIIKYLDKHYSGYTIFISKRKNNGNYFVKIRFDGKGYHSYYRSLVFDNEGKVIKG